MITDKTLYYIPVKHMLGKEREKSAREHGQVLNPWQSDITPVSTTTPRS